MELTVLMPCLDEAATVGLCVTEARNYMAARSIDGEVLVADNGSSDGSQAIARACGARLINVPESGYGAALLGGIRAAKGTFVIMGDADGSYDFSSLDLFMTQLRSGFDLVMGNRFRGAIEAGAMPALHRYFGNPVLSFIGRLFFGSTVGDFHCGLRGFRRSSALALGLQSPGMEFASEMVVKATLFGQSICDVPTALRCDGRDGPPHLRSWRDGWRHLRFLLMFSPRWLFFYPGVLLMVVGVLMGSLLVISPINLLSARLDGSSLVVCSAAVLLGYQAIWFAVLTKAFASREGLLPNDVRVERFRAAFPLEKALLVAGVAVAVGLSVLLTAVLQGDFDAIDSRRSLRLVIPSITLVISGVQTALSSLLWEF